jgi:hypothetical protein
VVLLLCRNAWNAWNAWNAMNWQAADERAPPAALLCAMQVRGLLATGNRLHGSRVPGCNRMKGELLALHSGEQQQERRSEGPEPAPGPSPQHRAGLLQPLPMLSNKR